MQKNSGAEAGILRMNAADSMRNLFQRGAIGMDDPCPE